MSKVTLLNVGMSTRARINVTMVGNRHVTLLSNGPAMLPSGTEGVITALTRDSIDLECRERYMTGIHAWGIKLRVTRVMFGQYFEALSVAP